LINEPWSAEEIREVWGLTIENIVRCEGMLWRKIHKKNGLGTIRSSGYFFIELIRIFIKQLQYKVFKKEFLK
jgi:hypothetical protein